MPERRPGDGGWRRDDTSPSTPLVSDQDRPLAWTGDPDPLEAGHVSGQYDPGLERLVTPPPRPSAGCSFVTGLLAGVVLGIAVGLLVAWLVSTARSAATAIPADASWSGTQVQASSGNLSRPSPRPSPFQEDDGGGIASASAGGGLASWYDDGPGLYGAVPTWSFGDPRYDVRVCTVARRCVVVTVRDFCGCPGNRIIDLSPSAFRRLAPLSLGLVAVTVEGLEPTMTLPPTDTKSAP